jgi:hypothetical protein
VAEALRHGVVPAVALAAHTRLSPGLGQALPIAVGPSLTAPWHLAFFLVVSSKLSRMTAPSGTNWAAGRITAPQRGHCWLESGHPKKT